MTRYGFESSLLNYAFAALDKTEVVKAFKRPSLAGSHRIFVITGLEVLENWTIVTERETRSSVAGEKLIFAYCLAQFKRSFLGSFAVDRYLKGAVF